MRKPFHRKVKCKIRNTYRAEWGFFKSKLWVSFKFSFVIFLASIVFFYLMFSYHPLFSAKIEKRADKLMMKFHDQWESYGLKMSMVFFAHNSWTFSLEIVTGLIPFLFLPIFLLIFNGILYAFFFTTAQLSGLNVLVAYFITIFPHGIFEYFGMFYAASLGIYLCIESSKKMIRRWRNNSVSFDAIRRQIFRSCILIIIPLYAVAAIVEGLITPLLVRTFAKAIFPF
ncbi:MAG: stage II sporulation protein M [Thermodesulfobacteriota bacterium]